MQPNPYSSPESLDATDIRHRPSRVASASFVLNIILPIAMLTVAVFTTASNQNLTFHRAMIVGIAGLIILALNLITALLGVVGLLRMGRMRLLTVVGAISAITVLGMTVLFFTS
jgi:hypothetical protein